MKKQALYIGISFLLFAGMVKLVHMLANKGLHLYHESTYGQMDLIFRGCDNQDYLFLGSSRTHYGINPLIIEKLSGKKALNAGLEGAKIDEIEIALQGYLLSSRRPEKIFLMIDPHSLTVEKGKLFNKIFLSSYLDNDSVYRIMRRIEGWPCFFWKYLRFSIITEYSDFIRTCCIKGWMGGRALNNEATAYKGYVSLDRSYRPAEKDFNVREQLDPEGVKILRRMIRNCSDHSIPVYLLQGPYLSSYYKKNGIDTLYKELQKQLSDFPLCKIQTEPLNYEGTIYFKDQSHLNDKGAGKYSEDLFNTFMKNEN